MEANELMIGDWVRAPSELNRYMRIRSTFDMDSAILYESIPLTQEILEKNGWKHEFDKTDYMVKYDLGKEGKNCWMMWSIKEHNLDIQRQDEKLDMYNLKVSRVVIPCNYVHQLQHALRLCGIEKEIEL